MIKHDSQENMPTIPRHFYYNTDVHPNESNCLVCGFVLATRIDYEIS